MRTILDEYELQVREIALAQCRFDTGADLQIDLAPDPRTPAGEHSAPSA